MTKEDILNGLRRGVVKLTHEPGSDSGTVCTIGEHWFYFGGQVAEDMNPEEFMEQVPMEDIADEILSALEGIRNDLGGVDEYLYYELYLKERLQAEDTLPAAGTHKLYLTCPICGNAGWLRRDDGWECAACGEFSYPEDMCSEAEEV